MQITILSDTHGSHHELTIPETDMVIHCGDLSNIGKIEEILSFVEWFSEIPAKHRVLIAGNHDIGLETMGPMFKQSMPKFINYLENNSVTIEGLNIYGTPAQPIFCDWAFNKTPAQLERYYSNIPDNTDILVTHCPPKNIMDHCRDGNVGCEILMNHVERIKPKIHCFGHIHGGYGILKQNGTTFVNASLLDENYAVSNKPIIIEL